MPSTLQILEFVRVAAVISAPVLGFGLCGWLAFTLWQWRREDAERQRRQDAYDANIRG